MGIAMVSLTRTKSGLWKARKAIPADVREAYGKREEKKTWPAELAAGQAKAELATWLTPIEERIGMLRASAAQTPRHAIQAPQPCARWRVVQGAGCPVRGRPRQVCGLVVLPR